MKTIKGFNKLSKKEQEEIIRNVSRKHVRIIDYLINDTDWVDYVDEDFGSDSNVKYHDEDQKLARRLRDDYVGAYTNDHDGAYYFVHRDDIEKTKKTIEAERRTVTVVCWDDTIENEVEI